MVYSRRELCPLLICMAANRSVSHYHSLLPQLFRPLPGNRPLGEPGSVLQRQRSPLVCWLVSACSTSSQNLWTSAPQHTCCNKTWPHRAVLHWRCSQGSPFWQHSVSAACAGSFS